MKRGFTDDEAPVKIFYELCSAAAANGSGIPWSTLPHHDEGEKCLNGVGQRIGANFFSEHFNQPCMFRFLAVLLEN